MINVMSWFFWLKNDYFLYKSDFQIHAAATIMEIYRIRHIVDGKQCRFRWYLCESFKMKGHFKLPRQSL